MAVELINIRCKKCNRLLMKAEKFKGEVKCPKCRYVNKAMTYGNGTVFVDKNEPAMFSIDGEDAKIIIIS